MKRVLIASLVVALTMTACATETTEEAVAPTTPTVATETVVVTEPIVEIVETEPVTEPIIEVTEPAVEEPATEPVTEPVTTPVVETKPSKPIEEVKVEETEPTETVETDNNYLGNFKLTAYCPCAKCCGKSDGITATGTVATQGRTIAVDPSVIPYGTEVVINGNTYVAEDCGGAIKSNKIDIYFDSHAEALQFGVQYADVYIKE